MKLVLIGLNHKTAPLHIRERVSFSDINIQNSYALLKAYPCLTESFILSTCNRVELYGIGLNEQLVTSKLKDFLYKTHELTPGCMEKYLYTKTDDQAMLHLSRVACGLDSMIIGENQILGQVKKAYAQVKLAGSIGPFLHKLLQSTLVMNKMVRNLTDISKGVTSAPAAALELIKKDSNINTKSVLVIGAGKVSAMAVARLADSDIKNVVIINRDKFKAEDIKKSILKSKKVRVESISSLKKELSIADIIIAATASVTYLITRDMIEVALKQRLRNLLLIDLGVPRNIEDSVRHIEGTRLYNIDNLKPVVDKAMRNRLTEAKKAEKIIKEHICGKLSLV